MLSSGGSEAAAGRFSIVPRSVGTPLKSDCQSDREECAQHRAGGREEHRSRSDWPELRKGRIDKRDTAHASGSVALVAVVSPQGEREGEFHLALPHQKLLVHLCEGFRLPLQARESQLIRRDRVGALDQRCADLVEKCV